MPSNSLSRWEFAIDRELRDVLIPRRFQERMRAFVLDTVLEEALCEVRLPAGYVDRLRYLPANVAAGGSPSTPR